MNPALVDVLDWVEEMRDDLRPRLVGAPRIRFDTARCGSSAQYRQHLRLGIPPCGSCKAAEGFRVFKVRQKHGDTIRANRRRRRAGLRAGLLTGVA